MESAQKYQSLCDQMVREQIERRGVKDQRLLKALREVPRHRFVPEQISHMAYEDCPLAIGDGQTISQPYIVGLMTELLELKGGEKVLEIGTGSGYQAAVLARLAGYVHSVERLESLAENAARILAELRLSNVMIHLGDGSKGWVTEAPYDGILVTAAAQKVPKPILEQLADDGRLVIPVGSRMNQDLQVWQRKGDQFIHRSVLAVAFVPLRGELGWTLKDWEESNFW
jgi:protein-L-isoaspartate(D-aspartate) O-methyltransferase